MLKRNRSKLFIIFLVPILLVALIGCSQQADQEYPTKAIDLVVAYGAGGGTDVTARLLEGPLSEEMGVPVTVRNITGAGGWTGWEHVANADPDGYTIGYINLPHVYAHYLDPATGIEASLDFWKFVAMHVIDPCLWGVLPDSPFQTVNDVIDYAVANPGELSISAHGYSGDEWLATTKVMQMTGAELNMIHNDSTTESIAQLLGGHIDILGANVSEVVQQVRTGEIRLLGVMWPERSSFYPDVPTFAEQGIDITMMSARSIAVPADTPDSIVKALQDGIKAASDNPETISQMEEMGLTLDIITGDELMKFVVDTEEMVAELLADF